VIATIHAESPVMAIQRLKGLQVKVEDFEMLLRGILVQFLMRTICGVCNGAKEVDDPVLGRKVQCDNCFGEGYAGRTVTSEIVRVMKPIDVQRIMNSEKDPEDKYWRPLWKDIESKVTTGVTDGAEVYRTFASELEEMANHSPVLREILFEQRALRDQVSANVASAQVEEMNPEDKAKQRRIAMSRLAAASIPVEVAEADVMSRDGEALGISRRATGEVED
jgi:hypothetical protein